MEVNATIDGKRDVKSTFEVRKKEVMISKEEREKKKKPRFLDRWRLEVDDEGGWTPMWKMRRRRRKL